MDEWIHPHQVVGIVHVPNGSINQMRTLLNDTKFFDYFEISKDTVLQVQPTVWEYCQFQRVHVYSFH